jgi:hypothetical protein
MGLQRYHLSTGESRDFNRVQSARPRAQAAGTRGTGISRRVWEHDPLVLNTENQTDPFHLFSCFEYLRRLVFSPRPLPLSPKRVHFVFEHFPMEPWPKPQGRCRVLSASCRCCPQGLLQVEEMADFPCLPVGLPPEAQLAWDTCPSSPAVMALTRPTPVPSHGVIPLRRVSQCSQPRHPAPAALQWGQWGTRARRPLPLWGLPLRSPSGRESHAPSIGRGHLLCLLLSLPLL